MPPKIHCAGDRKALAESPEKDSPKRVQRTPKYDGTEKTQRLYVVVICSNPSRSDFIHTKDFSLVNRFGDKRLRPANLLKDFPLGSAADAARNTRL